MSTPPVTLDEVKAQLNLTSTAEDIELQLYTEAATDLIEELVGPMVVAEFTESAECGGHGAVLLRHWPITEVASVEQGGAPVDVDLDRSDLTIGSVQVGRRGWVTVTYSAGRAPVPAALKLATLLTVDHLWETQRGRQGGFTAIHGVDDDSPVGGDASFLVMQGNALPPRAKGLLRPYLQRSR